MFKKAMKINPTYAEAYFNLGKSIKFNTTNLVGWDWEIIDIYSVFQGQH